MVCSNKDGFEEMSIAEDLDEEIQDANNVSEADSSDFGSSEGADDCPASGGDAARGTGLSDRLRAVLSGVGDRDLLLQQCGGENSVVQWLQALDLQVIGACRADERLKPLLKLNVSSGAAEDRLLAHLSQHFEAAEVGLLARCLCVPLVSIRVGKVIKKGTLLCPTYSRRKRRGHLNLILLPSSVLRISFVGDDGCNERLALVGSDSDSSVTLEELSTDSSGRSFLLKLPGGQVSYFWCSEKSALLGAEFLMKMKDLLVRKPSLSQLTGISETRLNSFASQVRAYLVESATVVQSRPMVSSAALGFSSSKPNLTAQAVLCVPKSSHSHPTSSQFTKTHSSIYHGSLSPRVSTFKDGFPSSSSTRSGALEKFKRHSDSHFNFSEVDTPAVASACEASATLTSSVESDNGKLFEGISYCNLLLLSLPEAMSYSSPSSSSESTSSRPLQLHNSLVQFSSSSASAFSPYYCWCPPFSSNLQDELSPCLPSISAGSLPLPPLSSLLSAVRSSSSLVPPKPPIDFVDTSLNFPALLPDPLAHIPLPVSSFVTIPNSQPFPTFTPFMSDPIVHIPVLDVCSSGQGYLVSAVPSMPTTIAPLLPNLVNPLIPESESIVEKSARETLRLLIGSTQTSPPLMEMLPAALTTTDDSSLLYIFEKRQNTLLAGSRGLYTGTRDLDVTMKNVSVAGLPLDPPCNDVESSLRRDVNVDSDNMDGGSSSLGSGCKDGSQEGTID